MTPTFFAEIGQVFQQISADPEIRVVIVWAEGKLFSAGLDMKEAASLLTGWLFFLFYSCYFTYFLLHFYTRIIFCF